MPYCNAHDGGWTFLRQFDVPVYVLNTLGGITSLLSSLTLVALSAPWVLVLTPFIACAMFYIQRFYLASNREIQRLNSSSTAPVYQLFEESLVGVVTVRCACLTVGKSTITLAPFRILEAVSGSIEIDGHDISKLGLIDLRNSLTIIPQDPVLFAGTIRSNLDPRDEFDDATIWSALERIGMDEYILKLEGKLRAEVSSDGSNFSAGQRQLLAMAMALLRKRRVVIFDEATSATDAETDALVQKAIRSEFSDCTVLTIAHRIATIMDSDRILVLDKGCVSEFDSPANLLQDSGSAFARMVASSQGH
ncbi:hypothetical protein RI367_003473 [Sorochytrium milnesiophthora]